MNFDPSQIKIHPRIEELREEFTILKPIRNDNENYWFCLKHEKRNEYIQKNKIYAQTERENSPPKKPEEHKKSVLVRIDWIPGYARKSGQSYNGEGIVKNGNKIQKSFQTEEIRQKMPRKKDKKMNLKRIMVNKKKKKPKHNQITGKKFIIEIDE